MRIKNRLTLGLIILLSLLAITWYIGTQVINPTKLDGITKDNLTQYSLSYVSDQAQIVTVKRDGSNRAIISDDNGLFAWPTWSPDGRKLIYSGLINPDKPDQEINLYLFNMETNSETLIELGGYKPEGLLANGLIHYTLWSPDNQSIAIIAVTSSGASLFVYHLSDKKPAQLVLGQGPMWIAWSPDSKSLLAHRRFDHFLIDRINTMEVHDLDISYGGYRAPAWHPFDNSITVAMEENEEILKLFSIEVIDHNRVGSTRGLMETSPVPIFLWSPDGTILAVSSSARLLPYEDVELLVSRKLTLLREDDASIPYLIEDNIIAYFWSPDSSKIAYVLASETPGVLRWMLLDVRQGVSRLLADFIPSREQLTVLQFFDQYAYSHNLWSPDSSALICAGRIWSGNITANLASTTNDLSDESDIILIETDGYSNPIPIAKGVLAFWSPK